MDWWYFQYTVKIWDELDEKEDVRSGVVVAQSFAEAMKEIEQYYKYIINVQSFVMLTEGKIYDFGDEELNGFKITRS